MPDSLFVALVHNAALLIALSYLYSLLSPLKVESLSRARKITLGLAVGGIGVIIMLTRWELQAGIGFDTRSVLLGVSGLFLGTIPTLLAMLVTGTYRLFQGGTGTVAGVSVVISSGVIGLLWRRVRKSRVIDLSSMELLLFGLTLHVAMLLLLFLMPFEDALRTLKSIGVPVVIIFPIATVLLGKLMTHNLQAHRAKALLAESEEQYRTFFENRHTPMLIIEPEHLRIIDANPSAVAFYGWTRDELRQKSIRDIGTLEADQLMEDVRHALEGERTYFRFKHRLADGSIKDVELYGGPIALEGRTLLHAIVHDVSTRVELEERQARTDAELRALLDEANRSKQALLNTLDEQKRIERELREREERILKLSAVAEQSPASVIITDLEGHIEYVNPKFTEITGYTLEDVQGKKPNLLRSEETPSQIYEELWSTITRGGVWQGELHNKKKDGTLFWERATIAPIRDAEGNRLRYLAIKEDVTEQKVLEAQYRQSQKMEAIGRLAGGIAHDFNNKLQAILGNTEMALERSDVPERLREDLEEIRDAALRSTDLTRQLLGFARKQAVQPQILDLNDTIARMMKMMKRLIGPHIEVQWKPGADLRPVRLDPSQLDQILANLTVNSRDAISDTGTLTIETRNVYLDQQYTRLHRHIPAGDYILVEVSDTGSGMTREVAEQIFDPYFTTKDVGAGTGLGLPTVYGIMKQNKGFIHVYSEIGMGTAFKLYFPAVQEDRTDTETRPEEADTAWVRGKETILLVEDEGPILELAGAMLRKFGYQVLPAQNPHDALALARKHEGKIDLMITDVIMPHMNGRELKEEIRRIYPSIKIIYMSGYTANTIVEKGIMESGTGFLAKPFSIHSLSTKVRSILDQ